MNPLIKLTRTYKDTPIYIGVATIVSAQSDGDETLVILDSGRHTEVTVQETPEKIQILVDDALGRFMFRV